MSRGGGIRYLLDEHYPGWLARRVSDAGVDTIAVVLDDELRGRDDTSVLRFAARERRVVVTEDVTTFSLAMAAVPDHVGVIFCHHARFPRTPAGLSRLEKALVEFAKGAPVPYREGAFVWWLAA